MISRAELNPHDYALTPEQAAYFERLYTAINAFRAAYGKPMLVTSGVRSEADQARINPKAKGSAHVRGAACDISDPDKSLKGFCLDNLALLEKLGLYIEDPSATPRWIHFQIIPPKSGHRIFMP